MTEDRFEAYFKEKIWEMVPAIYRHEDGLAENPDVLRALVEAMAKQAATLRRSQDRLWEDQFIELCNDWAVPYIGELVATRLVSALNKRARRVDVAKTIYYRRRKGTLAVLEELVSDITGWEGTVRESFRRLARAQHLLDPPPYNYRGRFTDTPPGGLADLRNAGAAELTNTPFDEFHHTPDLRKPQGKDGLYGIQRLLFYLYRLNSFQVIGVTPFEDSGSSGMGFWFDPSGRDIPLYMPANRPQDPNASANDSGDWGKWRTSYEWELPAPMRCRLLAHEHYAIKEKNILQLLSDGTLSETLADELRSLRGREYRREPRLKHALSELPSGTTFVDPSLYLPLKANLLVEVCGQYALYPDAVQVEEDDQTVAREDTKAGDLTGFSTPVTDSRVVIDPEKGRLLFVGDAPSDNRKVAYHYGFPAEIGAGTYNRRSIEQYQAGKHHCEGGEIAAANLLNDGYTQIDDSATYSPISNKLSVRNMHFYAANQERPYISLDDHWTLGSGEHEDAVLELDGIWLGAQQPASLILQGDYETVVLRHMSLDPGGPLTEEEGASSLPAIPLVIAATIETLIIDASITGPIFVQDDGYVEKLIIKDSIVQSRDESVDAINLPESEIQMERVTVIGDVHTQCLWASDSLIVGDGDIVNTQCGCFRFSAANKDSRLPRPYHPYWIEQTHTLFVSTRFGNPAFVQLSENAPEEIKTGAENKAEMGAYNGLLNEIKLKSLHAKVEEYMPFGLLPVYVFET